MLYSKKEIEEKKEELKDLFSNDSLSTNQLLCLVNDKEVNSTLGKIKKETRKWGNYNFDLVCKSPEDLEDCKKCEVRVAIRNLRKYPKNRIKSALETKKRGKWDIVSSIPSGMVAEKPIRIENNSEKKGD